MKIIDKALLLLILPLLPVFAALHAITGEPYIASVRWLWENWMLGWRA